MVGTLPPVYASLVHPVGSLPAVHARMYTLAHTSGLGNPLLPTVLTGGLRVRGSPLRKVPGEAKREVLVRNVLHHGAIP